MSAMLDPNAANRLAKLCGLFGSDHDGERAAAAAKADELVRRHGLSWRQVLSPWQQSESVEEMIAYALRLGAGVIGVWEEGFLRGVRGRQFLTNKQLAKLQEIVASVRRNGA